jgi:2-oxoisovalerate dehydrogenase E1 component
MAAALASEDPVVVFESQRLYDKVELFHPEGVPTGYYRIPLGVPAVRRAGRDLTILTIGPALYPALAAAEELSAAGIEAEVIDARTLVPFDYRPLIDSVAKTGRFLAVTEASERGSFAQTVAATVARHGFRHLKAPPRVIGAPNWIVPGADMETTYFPQAHDILDAVMADFFPDRPANRRGLRTWDDLALARDGL